MAGAALPRRPVPAVGFTQWDNQWYGGHATPGYSLLFPPLGAVFGPGPDAVASAVLATWSFSRLAHRYFPHARFASVLFRFGTVIMCLALPQEVFVRPRFMEKVQSYAGEEPVALPGPDRVGLLELLG